MGQIGPLAGERQSGGRLLTSSELVPQHSGRGRRGGRFIPMYPPGDAVGDAEDRAAMESAFSAFSPWLGPSAQM